MRCHHPFTHLRSLSYTGMLYTIWFKPKWVYYINYCMPRCKLHTHRSQYDAPCSSPTLPRWVTPGCSSPYAPLTINQPYRPPTGSIAALIPLWGTNPWKWSSPLPKLSGSFMRPPPVHARKTIFPFSALLLTQSESSGTQVAKRAGKGGGERGQGVGSEGERFISEMYRG